MKEWLKNILAFLIIVFGYGFALNVLFYGLRLFFFFDIVSVSAFGILYYFITEEILIWFRPRKSPAPAAEKTRGEKIAETRLDEKRLDKEGAMEKLRKKMNALRITEGKKQG